MDSIHRTVLLNETIDGLNLKDKSLVVDATFGGGGHSREICKRYKQVKIIALDQDKSVWERWNLEALPPNGGKASKLSCDISFQNMNFRDLNLSNDSVDAIIFDLGLSSDQLENSGRGFSFMKSEPLLMTMKENPLSEDITAKDIVNDWSEESLADILHGYGEEKFSRRIAKGIAQERKNKKIQTTSDLVKIIEKSVPARYRNGKLSKKLHVATKTFQALRIAVNDELNTLQRGLEVGFVALKTGGRMAVISFHSLEDRIVKRFYKTRAQEGKVTLINKKPITVSPQELKDNPRARSAKLRILEKIEP